MKGNLAADKYSFQIAFHKAEVQREFMHEPLMGYRLLQMNGFPLETHLQRSCALENFKEKEEKEETMKRDKLQWVVTGVRGGWLRGIDDILSILPEEEKSRGFSTPPWGLVYSWRQGDLGQRVSSGTGFQPGWEKLGDPLPKRAVGVHRTLYLEEDKGPVGEYYGARIEESMTREEYPPRPYSPRPLVTVEVYKTVGYDQCVYCGHENRGEYPCPSCQSS